MRPAKTGWAATAAMAAMATMAVAAPPAAAAELPELLARGEAAWSRRAEGAVGARAVAEPIGEAIDAFERALETDPGSLEARIGLLRSLYFHGEYVLTDEEEKLATYHRGRALAEEGLDRLTAELGRDPRELDPEPAAELLAPIEEAPGLVFWGAAHWGLWGRHEGKFAAARQGVAGTVRDYASTVIALDPTFEEAGGHRILGRLHTEAPHIPFITGWIDRDEAIRHLRTAVELAPQNLLNRLYLAEALLEHADDRRREALDLLREVAAHEPETEYAVEEADVVADAKAALARATG